MKLGTCMLQIEHNSRYQARLQKVAIMGSQVYRQEHVICDILVVFIYSPMEAHVHFESLVPMYHILCQISLSLHFSL